jgi:double-strand break repair protein MRE11
MQILQANDLHTALHVFVNKDDNMAFHSCLQESTEDARVRFTPPICSVYIVLWCIK